MLVPFVVGDNLAWIPHHKPDLPIQRFLAYIIEGPTFLANRQGKTLHDVDRGSLVFQNLCLLHLRQNFHLVPRVVTIT